MRSAEEALADANPSYYFHIFLEGGEVALKSDCVSITVIIRIGVLQFDVTLQICRTTE